ncbi:hypothetical protein BGZ54_000777, partial [Gamsiella multidivaricata]
MAYLHFLVFYATESYAGAKSNGNERHLKHDSDLRWPVIIVLDFDMRTILNFFPELCKLVSSNSQDADMVLIAALLKNSLSQIHRKNFAYSRAE